MLPLKYLFHDKNLALSILSRWNYDADQPNLMEHFRISSNAIYPFKHQDKVQFLRFAPAVEKSAKSILAELEFLSYLHQQGYPCLTTVLSKQGNELEVVETSKGVYHAVVFARVPGKGLNPELMTDEMVFGWGKALGCLHRLSKEFQPLKHRRIDYVEQLQWIAEELTRFPDEDLAREEVRIVSEWLAKLPKDESNFGLVHYDFETDNVFYDDETQSFHAIDFDDAVYHWFMMDVTTALMSYKDDAPEGTFESAKHHFIAGYRSEHELTDEMVALMPGFIRYQNLYGYVRILHSAHEQLSDEPEWMVNLRQRWEHGLKRSRSAKFGKPL